ncbi:uncharacterized protein HHUB_2923 [Halobacterium hubeiense]|uniref:Uncharacterized protein n=1 Tax=Halobacterium hubeiense TaxID=1407499 RepID=A0A0U5H1V1_9EURY|nr:uncharacterized protein HHUB_2923 [Halobacterium hubeiense]
MKSMFLYPPDCAVSIPRRRRTVQSVSESATYRYSFASGQPTT